MRKFFILLSVFVFSLGVVAQEKGAVQSANEAYSQGNFTEAVDLYKQVIEKNGESAAVYYNLGNSYYRLNKIAPAILSYERALLLAPGNKDIRFNLEIAKLKTVDKIEPVGDIFLVDWYNGFMNFFSTNQWSSIGITCFVLFIVCLTLFFFSRKIAIKKLGFYAGIFVLVFCLLANVFAYNQKKKLTERNTAIIFSPTVTIKSSPDNSGTDLFILHEGTKVEVKSKLGEWNEIETADGNVGWINSGKIEII
jgi:tetratricopeptide (TPR) repeat protein